MKLPIVVALIFFLHAPAASAQSVYAAAVVGAETMLTSAFEVESVETFETGGTAPFAGARVGVAVGSNWGVELEAIQNFGVSKTHTDGVVASPLPVDFPPFIGSTFPAFSTTVETDTTVTTLSPALWLSHSLNGRLDLVVHAGAVFTRTVVEQDIEFSNVRFGGGGFRFGSNPGVIIPSLGPQLTVIPNQRTRSVTYDAGPMAGVEVAIRLGDHVRVAPGVRMSAVAGGWWIRPGVAVGWSF